MEEGQTVEDFRRWKVPQLRDFLRQRGLTHSSKRKDELVALVFAAYKEKRPVILTGADVSKAKADEYQMGDYKEGKAYSYFDSKWLKEVWNHEVSPNSTICFLRSESTPSERLSEIPHKIWVAIEKKTGCIESAYCTCFAGLGSTCNHVAAVLFKLEFAWQQGWTNKSCTARPCEWNRYGATKHVLEPKKISEMGWRNPHHRKKGEKTVINPASRQQFSPRKKSSSQPVPSLERIIGCMYNSCPQACAFEYAPINTDIVYHPEADFNVSHAVEIKTSARIPPSLPAMAQQTESVNHFISELPKLTADEILMTEKETRLQSDSTEWKQQRLGRVTGSVAHRVMTRVTTITAAPDKDHDVTSLLRQIMGYTSPPEHIPALKYGRSMETEARQSYKNSLISSDHTGASVIECGLCIHSEKIFVGASPDGFVYCDCCGDGLLEIKCPLSIAHENPCNVDLVYLQFDDGRYSLRKTHPYYSQVQFQLGVTRRAWCDLFVYTRHGHITVRVQFDEERWKALMSAAEYFFQNYIASELVTRSLQRDMEDIAQVSNEIVISDALPGKSSISDIPTATTRTSETRTVCSDPSQSASGVIPVASDLPTDIRSTAKSTTRPAKTSVSSCRKKKGKRTKHAFSPLYSCNICGNLCKEASDLSSDADNSVQCDSENCQLWYHWSCVGFDDSSENWLCPFCSS